MKNLVNYNSLVELVNNKITVNYSSIDLEFDLFEHAEYEYIHEGYTVKEFKNGISLIEAGSAYFVLTSMVDEIISNIDEFHGNI